jgi:hypothetical protein
MEVLEDINALGCWEWRLHTYSDERLCLIGGGNLVYSHAAEVCFSGVRYVCCPARLMHARFRLAGWPETSAISMKVELDSTVQVFVIEAETTASVEAVAFFVVAERVELKRDVVSYRER